MKYSLILFSILLISDTISGEITEIGNASHQTRVLIQPEYLKYDEVVNHNVSEVPGQRKELDSMRLKAEQWVLSQMDESGWGLDTPMAIVSLYLSNPFYFHNATQDVTLITKKLHIQLSSGLYRNGTYKMTLSSLAHHINALVATCSDPRNYYGVNLVQILRERTSQAQLKSLVTPFVHLTLCLLGESTYEDILKTREFFTTKRAELSKIGLQSLAYLAAECIETNHRDYQTHVRAEGRRVIVSKNESLFGDVFTTSLVLQAKEAMNLDDKEILLWRTKNVELDQALSFIFDKFGNGSFEDILTVYYMMPILSGRGLNSLKDSCNLTDSLGLAPLEVKSNSQDTKFNVKYSLYLGNKAEMIHTLQIDVHQNTSVFDGLRIAQEENFMFSFKYDWSSNYPIVYSIGGIPNDAEQNKVWFLYKKISESTNPLTNLQLLGGDMRRTVLRKDDHIVFWYRRQN